MSIKCPYYEYGDSECTKDLKKAIHEGYEWESEKKELLHELQHINNQKMGAVREVEGCKLLIRQVYNMLTKYKDVIEPDNVVDMLEMSGKLWTDDEFKAYAQKLMGGMNLGNFQGFPPAGAMGGMKGYSVSGSVKNPKIDIKPEIGIEMPKSGMGDFAKMEKSWEPVKELKTMKQTVKK